MAPDNQSEPLVRPAPSEGGDGTAAGGSTPGGRRGRRSRRESQNMLPQRDRQRSWPERMLVRLIATCGIVGIGVAIGAIMVSQHSQGWLIGCVVSVVSVVLAGLLWSSRSL